MAGVATRTRAMITGMLLGAWVTGAGSAVAQVTPGPAMDISSPGASSTMPMIAFHPMTGQFGIVYYEPGLRRFVGGFLDQDGNRLAGPIPLVTDAGNLLHERRDVLPFPWSPAMLGTFQAWGYDAFGNNVFVGDAAGVAFLSSFVTSGLVNYTNTGGDKFVANNCGEHEDAGPSAVDTATNKFFLSYSQAFHFYNNGFCGTTGSTLMAAYHQNSLPFAFTNGPFAVESNSSGLGHIPPGNRTDLVGVRRVGAGQPASCARDAVGREQPPHDHAGRRRHHAARVALRRAPCERERAGDLDRVPAVVWVHGQGAPVQSERRSADG